MSVFEMTQLTPVERENTVFLFDLVAHQPTRIFC